MRMIIENTNDNDFIYSFKFNNVIPWFGVNEDGIFLYGNKNYKLSLLEIAIIEEYNNSLIKLNTMDILKILNKV